MTPTRDDLLAENYYDLIAQMQAAWGNADRVNVVEVFAFIESRATHKPTTELRKLVLDLADELRQPHYSETGIAKLLARAYRAIAS